MRVALIAHSLRAGGGISVGQNMMAALGRVAPEHQYFASIPAGLYHEPTISCIPSCEISIFHNSSYMDRGRYDTFALPSHLRQFGPDVVFALGNLTLPHVKAPQAVLCHNSFYWYPRKHFGHESIKRAAAHMASLIVRRTWFSASLRRASLVFCQTQTAADRIRAIYRFAAPVRLCPNAVSAETLTGTANRECPEPLRNLNDRIKLFCLTKYYPHKNLERLVELFVRYPDELSEHVVVLTIAANQHPQAAELIDRVHRMGLQDKIINVGPLRQEQLASYYQNCDALILPTLLESFSGTYVEAMHFGCPILTSDLDFAHEICGDAAVYFNPWQLSSILQAIETLPTRPDLVQRGTKRSQQLFRSWDQIATDVLDGLLSLAQGNQA